MGNKSSGKFASASKYGFKGILISFVWLSLSFLGMSCSGEGSVFNNILRVLNYPLLYLIAGSIGDFFRRCGLLNEHDFGTFLIILLVVYIIAGYLLGFCYYFICQNLKKHKVESDKLPRRKHSFVKYIGLGFFVGFVWGTIEIMLIMAGFYELFCKVNKFFMLIFDPLIQSFVSVNNISAGLLPIFLCCCMVGALWGIMFYLLSRIYKYFMAILHKYTGDSHLILY